jgi:hypothetical protein
MRLRRQNPMDKKNEKVRLLVVRLTARYSLFSLLSSLPQVRAGAPRLPSSRSSVSVYRATMSDDGALLRSIIQRMKVRLNEQCPLFAWFRRGAGFTLLYFI